MLGGKDFSPFHVPNYFVAIKCLFLIIIIIIIEVKLSSQIKLSISVDVLD